MSCRLSLLASASCAALVVTSVQALPSFLAFIPGSGNVPDVGAVGHINPGGGGGINAFGDDVLTAGKQWTVDVCYMDSDGDGQFNGAELGDPCCEWVQGTNEKLSYTTATAPGDKTSKQDPTIWAAVKCTNGEDPITKFAAAGGAKNNTSTHDEVGSETTEPVPLLPTATPKPTSGAGTQWTGAIVVVLSAVAAFL